jgi:hypothetical protein
LKVKMFVFVGLITLILKGGRFVYILLSLEMLVMGILIYNITVLTSVCYIIILCISVVSSVVGLVIIVVLLSSYGRDYVKF